MVGGIIQLAAFGSQDTYLTGNPQITFFKDVYKKHTNFSIDCIEHNTKSTISTNGGQIEFKINRIGDLIINMCLNVKMSASQGITNNVAAVNLSTYSSWINNTGHAIIEEIYISIGGNIIDKHYGIWLDIWNELTDTNNSEYIMLNKHSSGRGYLTKDKHGIDNPLQLYVPLKFWFCGKPGLAIPLISLIYHDIKVVVKTRGILGLVNGTDITAITPVAPYISLLVDVIFLDNEERRKFGYSNHEYLIEQVQYLRQNLEKNVEINFTNPIKELIWITQSSVVSTENTTNPPSTNCNPIFNVANSTFTRNNDYFNYQAGAGALTEYIHGITDYNAFDRATLRFNGQNRFSPKNASYFRTIQPLYAKHRIPQKHIYVYSFALKPGSHQPSGSCNFSKLDNVYLQFDNICTDTTMNIHIFGLGYNVLRISNGLSGLAFG